MIINTQLFLFNSPNIKQSTLTDKEETTENNNKGRTSSNGRRLEAADITITLMSSLLTLYLIEKIFVG